MNVNGRLLTQDYFDFILVRKKSAGKFDVLDEIINNSGYGKALAHDFAAGVYVKKADLPKLINYLNTIDFPDELEIEVTACLDASDVNVKMCQMCEDNKELYGTGVPEPTFFFQGVIYPENVQMFKKRTTTIKITLDGMDFLMFMANQDQIAEALNENWEDDF